jgi:hypothetical protein
MTAPPSAPDRRRRLAEAIRSRFAQGIELGDAVRHFIESTVSDATPETVARVLAAPSDFGAEPLMELVFFPEESQQTALEPILEAANFESGEEAAVLALFAESPLEARLRLAWTGSALTVPVPDWVAESFLRRLNIDYRADARILAALDRFLEPAEACRFRVRLRNARFPATERTIRFLARFLERFPGGRSELRPAFDFLMSFLPGIPEARSVYGALLDRKRGGLRALALARDAEARWRKANMEILLMQGFRAGHVDTAAVTRELALLDGIFAAVFGRVPAAAMEEAVEAVSAMSMDPDDLDALAARFSFGDGT